MVPDKRLKGRDALSRFLIPLGIALLAVGLLGPVLADFLPVDGFQITGQSGTEPYFIILPVEDKWEHLELVLEIIGFVLLGAGLILRRRAR